MIRIHNEIVKEEKSFFNQCVFHPTDAIEDPWGKKIIDKFARDGSIDTIRIYAMLEDIVYLGENGELLYDFRISDLRLDYLVECGFKLVIAYAGMPECIARCEAGKTSVSKNKTRYKGKMWNTNPPFDYSLWEEICYEYTRHIIDRYGERVVKDWRVHCFNEPDMSMFFLSNIKDLDDERRVREYLSLYEGFARGVRRADDKMCVGGPALAVRNKFLESFLLGVKERKLPLDYIALHFYGTDPELINSGKENISVDLMLKRINSRLEVVRKCGFADTPIVIDEWGACSHGFYNIEECKALLFRETEIYASYYVRFIERLLKADFRVENLMICLSGQHEMTEDFSGFRNFFSMNFLTKPIYNAFLLLSRLGDKILSSATDNENISIIPTLCDDGSYAVAISYASADFCENIEDYSTSITFDEDIRGKKITVYTIDKSNNNPYRMWEREGRPEIKGETLARLRAEGSITPSQEFIAENNEGITLNMCANSMYLIVVKE